jgi:signal transduction histidine kinase/CheY-like chemotaxis protein
MRLKLKFEYRITILYLLIGCLWILFSDRFLELMTSDATMITRLQTYKGWFYVLITGLLLYFLIKQHLKKLREAEHKARQSDQLKTAFIQNISHEIRTPMNGIIGYSELLKDNILDDDQKSKYASMISQSSDQLLNIVNSLLDLSLIETGNQNLNLKEIFLNKLTDEIYDAFRMQTKESISFSVRKSLQGPDSHVITDPVKVKQVLTHLLNNANKYTDKGHIGFGYELKDGKIEFFINDSGLGIKKDVQDKIFDRFYKTETDGSKLYNGLGLGLTISKGIAELLDGRIWFESEPGKGTVFYFSIPYMPVNKKQNLTQITVPEQLNTSEITILVAEDDEQNMRYISEILNTRRIKLIQVTNGADAVKMCERNKNINIILLDLKMPLMDGYDAVKNIKKIRPDLPAIAQTAYAMALDREEAINAGFDDYISKPFTREQLFEIIAKYTRN